MGTGIAAKLGIGRRRGGDVLYGKTENKVENAPDALGNLDIQINTTNDSNQQSKNFNLKTDTASLFNSDGFLDDATYLSRTDPFLKKKTRQLKWRQKFYEFYAAPITKYYSHFVSFWLYQLYLSE